MKERLRILITVKTYPIPSAKYGELVCTAGVTETGEFIRLYPINFRDQPYSRQYQKYQWIEVEAEKYYGRDFRKESYRPNSDTLSTLGPPIPTKRGDWSERSRYVLQNVAQSMEDLKERQNIDQTSLGIIRPKIIHDLIIEPAADKWKGSFLEELRQHRIWDDRKASKVPPRKVPFKFKYIFECNDERCKTKHRMMNEDWELGALYWKLVDQGNTPNETAKKVREKFLDQMCGSSIDTHFFVGTVLAHPQSWVVIGVYWPKIQKETGEDKRRNDQRSLFD